jgi:hypothetical protein
MTEYYAKQIIQFNEQSKKSLTLEADWILGIESDSELGKLVREKMINKITELDTYTEKLKNEKFKI